MPDILASIERRQRARNRQTNTAEEIILRIAEIERDGAYLGKRYENWQPSCEWSYDIFTHYEASEFDPAIYYAGGLANQPKWLLNDFKGFFALTEYYALTYEKERLHRRLAELNK